MTLTAIALAFCAAGALIAALAGLLAVEGTTVRQAPHNASFI